MTALPRLELANPDNLSSFRMDGEICAFDEAVITIGGIEEHTITSNARAPSISPTG